MTEHDEKPCPFCTFVLPEVGRELLQKTGSVVAFEDSYPSAAGHTLIIPRRHVGRILELTDEEHRDLWQVARDQLRRLEAARPDAYTIGVNDGEAAGQTVRHVHLHLIPRHTGDTSDAKGGVRWVIPETAPYWLAH